MEGARQDKCRPNRGYDYQTNKQTERSADRKIHYYNFQYNETTFKIKQPLKIQL